MKLVIVESPAKAKTINGYLGADYRVLASFGHIRDLPSKNGSVRPDEDFAMDYEISSSSAKHVKAIVAAMKEADAIYLATDPDREGEAISWHVIEVLRQKRVLKAKTPVYRVAFNEITKKAVRYAIEHPRELDMDLVHAQQARRALDYLVGFTLSPVLWVKLPGSRSAGRVQSVALRLICDREDEIERFVSKEYWDIKADMLSPKKEAFVSKLTHLHGKKLAQFDIVTAEQAHAAVASFQAQTFAVTQVEKKQVKRRPAPPFTTSSLQQEASRKLGFGAKRTMSLAQQLYEGIDIKGETVGLITYMRTDGLTVSQGAIADARTLIGDMFGVNYVPKDSRQYKTKAKNAQEAHEAIRPTSVTRTPDSLKRLLDGDQLKLYTLIWKRMVASQMENAIVNQVGVNIASDDKQAIFRATGSTIYFDGFLTLYLEGKDDVKDDDEKLLPPLAEGDVIDVKAFIPDQHFTQPPPRYTEASLVKKMEELGIGRPSTYASIISVLQDRNYVVLDQKRFVPEDRGRIVTAFLTRFFERYVEYDFTAGLEDQLDKISAGDIDWKQVLSDFWKDFITTIDAVKEQDISIIIAALEDLLAYRLFPLDAEGNIQRSCPSCENGVMGLKLGKFGAFMGCSNYPECKHTQQLGGGDGEDGEDGAVVSQGPRELGEDPETGLTVLVKKGPYGHYLQLGHDDDAEGKKKPKRMSLPKGKDSQTIVLQDALSLLSLPREVGEHPETGKMIVANIGRYGPYLQHDGKFTSLKDDDVLTIGINRAVAVIADSGKKKGSEPLKVLGVHPDEGKEIAVYDGRYGPYIKYGKLNVTLPKGEEPDTITLDTAVGLIASKAASKGKKGKKKVASKAKKK